MERADCGHEGVFSIGEDGKTLFQFCHRERERRTGRELLVGAMILLIAGIYFVPGATTKVMRALANNFSCITG
jgi:hypothetical protein